MKKRGYRNKSTWYGEFCQYYDASNIKNLSQAPGMKYENQYYELFGSLIKRGIIYIKI